MPKRLSPILGSARDPYREVIAVLMVGALAGAAGAWAGSAKLANTVLLGAAVTLVLAAGILLGVLVAQIRRARPARPEEPAPPTPAETAGISAPIPQPESAEAAAPEGFWAEVPGRNPYSFVGDIRARVEHWFGRLGALERICLGTGMVGVFAIVHVLAQPVLQVTLTPVQAGVGLALCLAAVGLCATGARYFATLDAAILPEAPGLCRGARVAAWIFVVAAASIVSEWARQYTLLAAFHFIVAAANAAVCYALFRVARASDDPLTAFPADLPPLSTLGSRANLVASVLDAGQRQLGIDLRSTWALTVVRRGVEPLVISLVLIGWLSTSVTVVGVQEQGLVERLGVPLAGETLQPGLHAHWPWPVDKVYRIPIRRVESIDVGHEGEEAEGPENVLWAVEHAANEYTLVLGNGRDLVTIDASIQYRIIDPRAWHYHWQNPYVAMHGIAYRAVMRNTVDRTLAQALSENIEALADTMAAMAQQEADSMGLGIKVVGMTFGGMHPPVPVAPAYEAVISAEIRKGTQIVNAQAFRNQALPTAQTAVLVGANTARAEAAQALAAAAGKAWAFRTLESQYRAEPELYSFRRRLEALEQGLDGHAFTVVDFRIMRDGGDIWVNP